VVLGDIVAVRLNVLVATHDISIMPEFLFFHELSNQGVSGWEMWQCILHQVPYELSAQRPLDSVVDQDGAHIPSPTPILCCCESQSRPFQEVSGPNRSDNHPLCG
jgi:hypothetical protein